MSKPFENQPSTALVPVTSEQVRAEHSAALLSMTPEQRRALQRLQQAKQQSSFNGRFPDENLKAIFEREALQRSQGVSAPAGDEEAPR